MGYSNKPEQGNRLETCHYYSASVWRLWLFRYKTRRQLQQLLLDDPQRLHHDLGLSTEAVLAEIKKPFWQP